MTIEPSAPKPEAADGASVGATIQTEPIQTAAIKIEPIPTGAICGNCGTPLRGEYCCHCGQPVSGLVRHFSSVMGDLADTILQIDTRLTRTLVPLLLRPGYLSREYFVGRRVRYVSPVRLFFFISVIAFFVAQWSFDQTNTQAVQFDDSGINKAMTVAAVEQQRDAALHAIDASTKAIAVAPDVARDIAKAGIKVRAQADARIAELNAAQKQGKPPPMHYEHVLVFDGAPWDPVKHPLHSNWLPTAGNAWLNSLVGRTQDNLARIQQNPKLLMDAWLGTLPSTLFLLLPLFAGLLKIAYLFKRRLYMEHFIVALHSHAFLCFALLLALVLGGLAAASPSPWSSVPLRTLQTVLIAWMPIYLLLMQKRVYAQSWAMTSIKYIVLGTLYAVLLSFGAAISMLVKLVWL